MNHTDLKRKSEYVRAFYGKRRNASPWQRLNKKVYCNVTIIDIQKKKVLISFLKEHFL